ncbi:hypothetical protein E1181_12510 [Saccharopolyspora terrae]|uniref:Uncharacterized protein n=1 Tax=Saccharopolyspora terrae TaxID=2530384 RepID=A0A4R4VV64_9PSEU|nr:hypothetical protein E1181_12510 [Saccharopolyspora terrae]
MISPTRSSESRRKDWPLSVGRPDRYPQKRIAAERRGIMSVLDTFRLDGKVAIVTGASSGLGAV